MTPKCGKKIEKAEGKGKANEAMAEEDFKEISTKAKKMFLKQSLAFLETVTATRR